MLNKHRLKEFANSIFLSKLAGSTGTLLALSSKFLFILNANRIASKLLLSSIRYSYNKGAIKLLAKLIRDGRFPTKSLLSKPTSRTDAETRAIILSSPYYQEDKLVKGVMLLKFTHTFSYYPQAKHWEQLNRLFAFILEPSWSGYADADIINFIQCADHCVVQATETQDRALINSIFPSTPCSDTGSSNWVDYNRFCPAQESANKAYDAIYIANLNPIKRVYRAIDVMADAAAIDENFKGLIVCAGWGSGQLSHLEEYAIKHASSEAIKVIPGVQQSKLVEHLHLSKFSILLSLKEGSNRVLFESMFANTPVVCLAENIGVNKSYINAETGLLTFDSEISEAMVYMSKNYKKYEPRSWAETNISPEITTKKLAAILATKYGPEVNSELAVKVNTPELNYFNSSLERKEIMRKFFSDLDSARESEILASLQVIQPHPTSK